MKKYILDACSLIAVLNQEDGADSILLAQSIVSEAIVISSDHHEFDIIDENEHIEFLWIR